MWCSSFFTTCAVDCALGDVGARPAYTIGWVGCVRACVAACAASEGAVMPQEGVGVEPLVLCSVPIGSVSLVDTELPTRTPGGGGGLVVVMA